MKQIRFSGFQWAMMVFIFFIIAEVLHMILGDYQEKIHLKRFIFDVRALAPFIAFILCIIVFKHRTLQLQSMKFTINLKVIERMLLALILPVLIFILCMLSFNTFADSFVLLQGDDLSVSIFTILIGQLIMAFLIELGFRSYLQNILETKLNTLFASIAVGVLYAIFNINLEYSFTFTLYNVLYWFAFSMIVGELIRATNGRTIYIATIFHTAMSFGLVLLFNEELGNIFAMKVIALSTSGVALGYIVLTLIIRGIAYLFTRKNLDEVEANNYLDHVNEESELSETHSSSSLAKPSQDNSDIKNDSVSEDASQKYKDDVEKTSDKEEAPNEIETENNTNNQTEDSAFERAQFSVEHSKDEEKSGSSEKTERNKNTVTSSDQRTPFETDNDHPHRR
ncbi:CPBP family glutamic-type intramembrane protease [Staphylococcus marylandisciuri]|uniref:CPBP family glutamic-type intramembrane protease n=1 Tax=Staphylococcus marylandisciuri TaxID=2981529 RepID=UPI0027B88202|nr:CPBP family glutamic-type intramembrane protease [Staphylococcus marylandisciuri]